MSGVITIDVSEEFCLSKENVAQEDIDEYKTNVLPVLAHFDKLNLLKVVSMIFYGFA